MAEELGTKDVLEQVDARIGNVEQHVRDLRVEMNAGFARVDNEIGNLRNEMRTGFERVDEKIDGLRSEIGRELNSFRSEVGLRFGTQLRWTVGFVFAGWITLMTSIWFKG